MEKLKNVEVNDVEFNIDINLERYTTIKLGNIGSIAICKSEKGLIDLIEFLLKEKIKYHLVGWGANQVLLNSEKTLFIKLDFPFDRDIFNSNKTEFNLPASVPLNLLTSIAKKKGFSGWEIFTGIPASLGGAICMNAGTALGEIGQLIKSIRILKTDGSVYSYHCKKKSFRYRNNNFLEKGEVILSAIMFHNGIDEKICEKITNYLDYRNKTQPLKTKNCGSVFKNLDTHRAGIIIDSIGLKGFGTENIAVSTLHANFIENTGEGTAREFQELIDALGKEIERHTGLKFELEVKVY
ncbi:MAG: UDP-N-acetylmuramate dehydrogenase [Bacteriovoracaceae bacterium]|jgi:UDP-N-acetylmuramate dehydrogenase